MDKLNCFKKSQQSKTLRKVCLYSDAESRAKAKEAQKKRKQSKSNTTGFHLHHNNDTSSVRDSMQYYRIWIYSCNVVLALTSVIFIAFAAFVLSDVRLSLLRGFELYHPTFLYAYLALLIQCGIIQTVGCLGAKRLSHKLLSIYWVLLLILTLGDIIVGLVWVFKLDDVKQTLRPALTKQFLTKYSIDGHFTEIWNTVQSQDHCCGVDGPIDFDKFITTSSVIQQQQDSFSSGYVNDNMYFEQPTSSSSSYSPFQQQPQQGATTPSPSSLYLRLPDSCCVTISYPIIQNAFPHSNPHQDNTITNKLDSDSSSSPDQRIHKRHISNDELNFGGAFNFSEDELIYSSKFINSKHLTRHQHLRHFIHPRKTAPTILPNSYSHHHYHHQQQQQQQDSTQLHNPNSNNEATDDDDDVASLNPISNDEQLTELLIPFSCRNPAHNQIPHHQSSLPQINSKSGDDKKSNPNRRNAILPNNNNNNLNDRPLDDDSMTKKKKKTRKSLMNDNQPNSHNLHNNNDENHIDSSSSSSSVRRHSRRHAPQSSSSSTTPTSSAAFSPFASYKNKVRIFRNGCYMKLTQWLDHVTGILFILGFCIIGFVKVCFVVILRYEIREMIDKINLLETEGNIDGNGLGGMGGSGLDSPTTLKTSAGNLLQKQLSLQGNSYISAVPACHFIKSSALELQQLPSPFYHHNCSSNFLHHHQLPPHYAQQHRHSTTPYWDRYHTPYLSQHRGSHCGSILGTMGVSMSGGCPGRRRPSGRSLNDMEIGGMGLTPGGGDVCCSNHSQETVNMTLLITSPTIKRRASTQSNYSTGGGGGGRGVGGDTKGIEGSNEIVETSLLTDNNAEEDPQHQDENISLQVPVKNSSANSSTNISRIVDQYEIRRSNFANHYCTWDSNVSCDSSASNVALDGSAVSGCAVGRDHSSSSSLHALGVGHAGGGQSSTNTQVVKVDMECHHHQRGIDESLSPTQIQFIDEDQTTTNAAFSNNPLITYDIDNNDNDNAGASAIVNGGAEHDEQGAVVGAGEHNINESVIVNVEGQSASSQQRLLQRQNHSIESSGTTLLAQHSTGSSTSNSSSIGLRKNGNNNSIDSGQSFDSDYIMSFIGTAV